MKEVLFVIIEEYADWEAAFIASALNDSEQEDKKYAVKTVSLSKEPVRSIGGFTVLADYSVEDTPEDFAALLLIGGTSWRTAEAKKVLPLVRRALELNVPVGAICDGTVFLGMNGFLNGVRHTSNRLETLKSAAGESYTGEENYIERQSVSDGGIITANGSAHMEFAKDVLEALRAYPQAEIDEWYGYFKKGQYNEENRT